jgi:hypothetical protein
LIDRLYQEINRSLFPRPGDRITPPHRLENLNPSHLIVVTPLEQLDEMDLDFLSDEEVLSYLQAEGIDCGLFLDKACRSIGSTTGVVV